MKKRLMIFACIVSLTTKAQTPVEMNLWPPSRLTDTARGKKLVEHDISKPGEGKVEGREVIRLTDVTNPTITIFKPENANGTAVIIITWRSKKQRYLQKCICTRKAGMVMG